MRYNTGNNKCFPLKSHHSLWAHHSHAYLSHPFLCVWRFLSLGITSASRVLPLNTSTCKYQTLLFPAPPKSRKSHRSHATAVDQFRQAWAIRGTGLAATWILCSLVHVCPTGSSLVSVYLNELMGRMSTPPSLEDQLQRTPHQPENVPTALCSYRHGICHPILRFFGNGFASPSGLWISQRVVLCLIFFYAPNMVPDVT